MDQSKNSGCNVDPNAGHSTSKNAVEQGGDNMNNTTSNGTFSEQHTNPEPNQSQEQSLSDTNHENKNTTTSKGHSGQEENNPKTNRLQEQHISDEIHEITEEEKIMKWMKENETLRKQLQISEEEKKKLQEELSEKEITIINLREGANRRPERPKNAYPTDHGDKGRLERPKSAYPVQRYSLEEMQTKIYDQQSTIDRLTTLKSQKKEECVRHCKEMDVLKGDLKHYENAITSLKEENIKNEKTILRLKDDNNELLNRLSKIASDRLTYENTDVTDLSDETRPSKLSEQMSELYDNQWTSAFEELKTNGFEDKIAIDILLNIVTETNEVCKAMAFSHYQKIEEACTFFVSSPADMAIKEKIKIFKTGKISIEMKQDVKRIWRESSKKVLKKVIPIIEGKVANKFDILLLQMSQTPLYMKGCAELCWMMNIQEKPMHLDTSVLDKDGHKYFDTEKFRSYTKTGQYVAYVVWPALYLFEGGSLLKKGVAQGLKVETGANGQDHSRSVPRS